MNSNIQQQTVTMLQRHHMNIRKNHMSVTSYQTEAMKWIIQRELIGLGGNYMTEYRNHGKGGILALEMGLGKTMLMLSTILCNIKAPVNGSKGGTLIVVPCNLLKQWSSSIQRFIGIKPLVYYGSKTRKYTRGDITGDNGYVVITSYGTINKSWTEKNGTISERSLLTKVKWGRIIYDEAHHLRNNIGSLKRNAMLLKGDIKWLLTGTPINNSINDLTTLFSVLNIPKNIIINCYTAGESRYKHIVDNVLYKSKKEVGIELPPITIDTIEVVPKTDDEKKLVDDMHLVMNNMFRNYGKIDGSNVNRIIKQLFENKCYFELLIRSRQSCIMPAVLREIIDNKKNYYIASGIINPEYADLSLNQIASQSKIHAIVEKVCSNKGGRKIIFCHYRKEIDNIYTALKSKNPSLVVQKIDGRTKNKTKKYALEICPSGNDWVDIFMSKKFMDTSSRIQLIPQFLKTFLAPDVLILQINACCEGLNLQHFNEVYFSSPHWNPAVEGQAIARVYRIGQSKPVKIYKFITSSKDLNTRYTIDEYSDIVQSWKREVIRDNIIHPENLIAYDE